MSDGIIVAIISGGLSLIATIITIVATSRKTVTELMSRLKVLEERINAQKESIDKHNNFGLRIPVLEEQVKTVNQRLDAIERRMKE